MWPVMDKELAFEEMASLNWKGSKNIKTILLVRKGEKMAEVLKKLNKINPGRNIASVFDQNFKKFGTIHKKFKNDKLIGYLDQIEMQDDIKYVADLPEMRKEMSSELDPMLASIYAGMEVRVGHCCGRNNKLNALEYHQGSELYVNGTDMVMLLGLDHHIDWPGGTYDSSLIEAFYAPRGLTIELKGGCMHFVPVNVYPEQGINVIVALIADTNSPIDFKAGRGEADKLIIAKNTWFIAHPDYKAAREAGQHLGIEGENFCFNTF